MENMLNNYPFQDLIIPKRHAFHFIQFRRWFRPKKRKKKKKNSVDDHYFTHDPPSEFNCVLKVKDN